MEPTGVELSIKPERHLQAGGLESNLRIDLALRSQPNLPMTMNVGKSACT
jgi:hypothetical protein